MYDHLNRYLERLRKEGELLEIGVPVCPEYEITEITDRFSSLPGGGKALLFTETGTPFPVATNLLGSDRRICLALGVERLEDLARRIEKAFHGLTAPKTSFGDKLRTLPLLGEISRWMPRTRRGRGACQQVVMEDPDLRKLPVLTCRPYDGGPFVTLPLVHTLDPATGVRNVGMYRMQVYSARTTGMHWHRHKTGARHYDEYRKLGRRMPVTVCLGGDPVYTYAATAPVPDNVDEYLLAGFIRRRPVELVRCLTNELEVPADCDFVIEGYVDPAEEPGVEGAFGDHTGFYSLTDLYPTFHVTCITHRRDAVYPATVVGVPPQEDRFIAKATEKIFLAPIRLTLQPEVADLWMPEEGTAHNLAVVNIGKRYPGQAFKVAASLWGAGQMMFNKFMVITDAAGDIRRPETLREALRNVSVPRDILFSRGPLDVLDHAGDVTGAGGKLCIDATRKLPEETGAESAAVETEAGKTARTLREDAAGRQPEKADGARSWNLPPFAVDLNDAYADGWDALFLSVKRDARKSLRNYVPELETLLRNNGAENIRFVLFYDDRMPLTNVRTLLWLAGANCDAVRDVAAENGRLFFDARVKAGGVNGFRRRWPNVVASGPDTIGSIDKQWSEMGLGDFIPSPSLEHLSLVLPGGAEVEPE